ncbi:14853_t:CDS:1, partial [Acaulospora colombiana]
HMEVTAKTDQNMQPIPLSDMNIHEVAGNRGNFIRTESRLKTVLTIETDDLAFTITTSYPRGGTSIALKAGTARECQQWMKAIEDTRLAYIEGEKKHIRRQSQTGRGSIIVE